MFEIVRKSLATGVVTTSFPLGSRTSEEPCGRGRPQIDFASWKDARPATAACPTGALAFFDSNATRSVALDLGKCTFCGMCAEADPTIRMSTDSELATTRRQELVTTACYEIATDGTQVGFLRTGRDRASESQSPGPTSDNGTIEALGTKLQARIKTVLRRSLHIRQVDAGSCNGCEIEIVGLNSPIYDIERFGIHFVASPRHADMLLVTGPVSRNMELALKKTYEATPAPRLVVAVGACGCSGGIFGQNYASVGGVDKVIPVDVYIPGCPPNPYALLKGILLAIGRWEENAQMLRAKG